MFLHDDMMNRGDNPSDDGLMTTDDIDDDVMISYDNPSDDGLIDALSALVTAMAIMVTILNGLMALIICKTLTNVLFLFFQAHGFSLR